MLTLRKRASGFILRAHEFWDGGARLSTRAVGPDEWWSVDGEILRLRPKMGGGHKIVNMEEPNPRPRPVSSKQRLANRNERLQQIRIREHGQELYWPAYMDRLNQTREQWEKLYWDAIPKEPEIDPASVNKQIDHYQVLGLKNLSDHNSGGSDIVNGSGGTLSLPSMRRRHKPYSPLEIKAAFRDKAMIFHPDNSREKNPKTRAANMVRFRQIWESYKNLQNKRSW